MIRHLNNNPSFSSHFVLDCSLSCLVNATLIAVPVDKHHILGFLPQILKRTESARGLDSTLIDHSVPIVCN